MSSDDRISLALTSVDSRPQGLAARTLGLMLALCLAGLAGQLTFETVVAAFGFVAAAGLKMGQIIVCRALRQADRGVG